MAHIKIHAMAIAFILSVTSIFGYLGIQAVRSDLIIDIEPEPVILATPTPAPTALPSEDSGVKLTEYGYYITFPELGLVTYDSMHKEQLDVPVPGLPVYGQSFSHYPRNTILVWGPVLNASHYRLDIQVGDRNDTDGTIAWQEAVSPIAREAWFTFTMDGPRQCRWRVTAFDRSRVFLPSEPCEWQVLEFEL